MGMLALQIGRFDEAEHHLRRNVALYAELDLEEQGETAQRLLALAEQVGWEAVQDLLARQSGE